MTETVMEKVCPACKHKFPAGFVCERDGTLLLNLIEPDWRQLKLGERYEVLGLLAESKSSLIFTALDKETLAHVAVKMLREPVNHEQYRRRLHRFALQIDCHQ